MKTAVYFAGAQARSDKESKIIRSGDFFKLLASKMY
jgi:hypothetical protein